MLIQNRKITLNTPYLKINILQPHTSTYSPIPTLNNNFIKNKTEFTPLDICFYNKLYPLPDYQNFINVNKTANTHLNQIYKDSKLIR